MLKSCVFLISKMLRSPMMAATVALVAIVASSQPAYAECLDARAVNAAVASGQVLPLRSVSGALGGEVVRASLCRQGGRLVYVLSVMSGGRVSERVVDARTGRVLR